MERVPKNVPSRKRDLAIGLTDDEVRGLGESALLVRDDFIDEALVAGVRAEIDALAAREILRPAGVSRGVNYRREEQVRGDLIGWLDPDDASPNLLELHTRFEQLRDELNRTAYLGLDYFEVQIAQYPGAGSGYERHVDAFPGSVNRRVTAICYLNEGWTPDHGGMLRAWTADGQVREVEPVAGRLVVFVSDQVPHEVLPTYAPRCAVTAWYRHRSAVVR
ncbi:MAG: 2OG-Fe(II) oxygenase [Persicimonas sp.]